MGRGGKNVVLPEQVKCTKARQTVMGVQGKMWTPVNHPTSLSIDKIIKALFYSHESNIKCLLSVEKR